MSVWNFSPQIHFDPLRLGFLISPPMIDEKKTSPFDPTLRIAR
jgi:hypothetical protein